MKNLRIHYFQHVPHEGLGSISEWVSSNGHSLTSTKFFEDTGLPGVNAIDWLIIMGGPMNINDEEDYPWLADEKRFIHKAIDAGKTVLGICLGSQLLSASLGARVYKNKENEIGWFDVELTPSAQSGEFFSGMGKNLRPFHWHGDTFDLPDGAVHLASSAGCRNQAFIFGNKVLGLQFHLEITPDLLLQMIEGGRKELTPGKYIQSEEEILKYMRLVDSNKKILFILLTRLAGQASD